VTASLPSASDIRSGPAGLAAAIADGTIVALAAQRY
jgi:hypothetical protein